MSRKKDDTSNHFVLRSAGLMAVLTMMSRVLGLIRDTVLSYYFGTTHVMDAFSVAFRIPNTFRRLVGEGAMTAAFVPIFTDYKNTHSKEDSDRFVSTCFYTLALLLLVITVLGILFAPWYIPLVMPNGAHVPGKWEITIQLTRVMFPYIFFISLAALAMAALNTFKIFGPPMFAPVLLNLSIILSTVLLYHYFPLPIFSPAAGVMVGGVLQLSIQIPFLWRKGVRFRPAISFKDPHMRMIGKKMVPGIFGSGIAQINALVCVYFISLAGVEGLQWAMYISGRLVEVVHGVYTVALSTALLPAMSEHAFDNDMSKIFEKLVYGLRMAVFLTFPATAGLILLRYDIIRIIFQRGHFTASSTVLTADVLFFYAFCLTAYAGIYILNPAFYSLKDIKTPAFIAGVALVINVVTNAVFIHSLREGAPPLALAVSSFIQLMVLWITFRHKYGSFPIKPLVVSLVKFSIGTAALVLFLLLAAEWGLLFGLGKSFISSLIWLLIRIIFAVAIYLGILFILKSPELNDIFVLIKNKLNR